MAIKPLQFEKLTLESVEKVVSIKLEQLEQGGYLDERDFFSYYLVDEIILLVAKKQCGLAPEEIITIDITIDLATQQTRFCFYDGNGEKIGDGLTCVEKRTSPTDYSSYRLGAGWANRSHLEYEGHFD